MTDHLADLLAHLEWADAEYWSTLRANPLLLEDADIRTRLYHIHLVEEAYCAIIRGERPRIRKFEEFPDAESLRQFGQNAARNLAALQRGAGGSSLERTVTIPWFRNPPLELPVMLAFNQVAMHSHYHRAQLSLKLRERGIDPPATDFITWVWKGRPEPGQGENG